MQITRTSGIFVVLIGAWLACQFTACVGPLRQTTVFEQGDVRVGIESDLTTERTTPPSANDHPYRISAEAMRMLLQSIEVSGYGGVILGVFQAPRPIPVFTSSELDMISAPIAQAFLQAARNQRVFFSIPSNKPAYPNDREKTAGALFFRDGSLYVLLNDHYAFSAADTGGGEGRDPRDTKGMKLWVRRPAHQAQVLEQNEPRWGAFEKVHISFNAKDALAARQPDSSAVHATDGIPAPAATRRPQAESAYSQAAAPPTSDDLKLQIRELTNANLDLRNRLNEQRTEIGTLRQELDRLRQEIKPKSPKKPSNKMSPKPSGP